MKGSLYSCFLITRLPSRSRRLIDIWKPSIACELYDWFCIPSEQVASSPGHSRFYLVAVEKNREKAWDQNYTKQCHGPEMVDVVLRSLRRPSPDFSPRLCDTIWEWPGDEATCSLRTWCLHILLEILVYYLYTLGPPSCSCVPNLKIFSISFIFTCCSRSIYATMRSSRNPGSDTRSPLTRRKLLSCCTTRQMYPFGSLSV